MKNVYAYGVSEKQLELLKENYKNVLNFDCKTADDADYILFYQPSNCLPINYLKIAFGDKYKDLLSKTLDPYSPIFHSENFQESEVAFVSQMIKYVEFLSKKKPIILMNQRSCLIGSILNNINFNLIANSTGLEVDNRHNARIISQKVDIASSHSISLVNKEYSDDKNSTFYTFSNHCLLFDSVEKNKDVKIISNSQFVTKFEKTNSTNEEAVLKTHDGENVACFYVPKTRTMFVLDDLLNEKLLSSVEGEYLVGMNMEYLNELFAIIYEENEKI
jgi:hypothetical protein